MNNKFNEDIWRELGIINISTIIKYYQNNWLEYLKTITETNPNSGININ
jgi:hypothetical protein